MVKTKLTRLCEPSRLLVPRMDTRYNPATGHYQAYCYDIEEFSDGRPIDRVSAITADNDNLVLPLETRPCTHTVNYRDLSYAGSSHGVEPYLGFQHPDRVSTWYYPNVAHKQVVTTNPVYIDVDSSLEDDLSYRAFQATRPSFSSDFSLVNFVLELKDFNKLFKLTDEKWSLKNHVENGFLNWTFGWVPFASDLVNLHGAYLRTKNVWKHILDNSEGQVVSSIASKTFSKRTDTTSSDWKRYTSECVCTHKVQTRYTYDVLDVTTGRRTEVPTSMYAASVAQALGLCANPAIIWNALPFSFVVDWFVPIADALEEMKKDTFVPGHIVNGCDRHISKMFTYEENGFYGTSSTGLPVSPYTFKTASSLYSRMPGLTDTSFQKMDPMDKLSIMNPTGKQWFIGAILGSAIFL